MKFCPVVPPACATQVLPHPHHGMFAFATECYQGSNPGYGDYFRSWQATALQAERGPLVLDNPIYEGRPSMDKWDLQRVQSIMKADFLIVPDVRHDMKATCDRFYEYWHGANLGEAATGVIQGTTWEELIECFQVMRQGTRKFALPKDLALIEGVTRHRLVSTMIFLQPNIEVHLLGGDWPYVDEGQCAKLKQVKSMDSAEPFNAAYVGLSLAKSPPPKRPAGWELITPKNLGDGFLRDFHGNIEVVERLAKCS